MQASGITWPPGPYRLTNPRHIVWLRLSGWALIVIATVMIVTHGRDRWLPQNLADLAATAGLGQSIDGAAVESWNCGPYARDSFWERSQRGIRHQCTIRIRGAISTDYEFRTGYSAAYAPGRVVRIGTMVAVAWPGWVMLERLTSFGTTVVIGLLLSALGLFILRELRRARSFERPDARIVDVDLLCRKLLKQGALWHFAYDFHGRRVIGQETVLADPILTDGVVTRGAAIIAPDGKAQLLTQATTGIALPTEAIAAHFHAYRPPLTPGFAGLVAAAHEGSERDYVAAYGRAWHDPDVAEVNRAIIARHDAALSLDRARVDALLRQCRSFIPLKT